MINLCCILIISIAVIILVLLIYKDDYKLKVLQNRKVYFCVALIVLVFPLFLFINVMAKTEYNIENNDYQTFDKYKSDTKKIKKLGLNKIIIIGDSRMELIEQAKEELDIPNNFIFDAKSGARIEWTKDTAIPKLKEILEKNSDYNCHVVFNMGVNDLNDNIDIRKRVNEYFDLYKKLITEYNSVEFYFLSVNPIDEEIINNYWDNKRTNEKIEKFNIYTIKLLNKSSFNNVTYCDSYHKLNFTLPDGLHYDIATDQKIINYIKDECVILK